MQKEQFIVFGQSQTQAREFPNSQSPTNASSAREQSSDRLLPSESLGRSSYPLKTLGLNLEAFSGAAGGGVRICMASGILDADKISKGKSKWGEEGNKVYTRRFKRIAKNTTADTPSSPTTTDTVTVAATSPPTTRTNTSNPASPPTATNNEQNLATEDANSEHQHTLSPVVEVSDDHSVQIAASPNRPTGNGVIKPVVVIVGDRVKINLKAAKSKNEIIELREKLRAELNRVRRVSQKLEDKEADTFSAVLAVPADVEAYSHSQYSGNDIIERRALLRVNSEMGTDFVDRRALMRLNSDMGSAPNTDMRPFRQLNVSVVDNNNHGVGEFVEKEKRTPKANQYYRNSDFLLGKDRLPPETNKRQKANGGRKHSKESDYSSGHERHRNQMFKNCNNLLQRLMKHKHGWVFNEPVNAKLLGLHDYHDIIKHPMDFGTIKSRLAQNFYKSPMEFAEDVRLTFYNAMTYNPKGQDVHVMAEQLSNIFEERWSVIESESNPDWRYGMIYDANTPTPTSRTPTSRKAPHFAHAPSRTLYRSESMSLPFMNRPKPKIAPPSRTPAPKKPKAKDPNKRNMTYEEKQKLSTNLQSLPSEKLDNIVQIIKKKNTSLSQHDDEIEVDIDSVDIETLWELDRFVTNYKKSLSKHRRRAELAQQANRTVLQNPNPVTSTMEAPKENNKTRGEKSIAGSGGPGEGGDNGVGSSRSSSSSSSSSDSGSSSSDSDSDSSSEDGSDADAAHSPTT
ncbi:unnamed protein product [Lactuca virosa]|uniref:Transcription factor GTE4 n=1 Tax=Lactuca virosa TaxID=75947 RepID=A0AAU9PIF6_9ASTR|nr:unnamed protein product [Lactuca virosa]